MRGVRQVIAVLFVAATLGHIVAEGGAREGFTTSIYEGQIKSINIEKCGLQPGLCEGSIVLAQQRGDDARVDIRVGTWIKRDDQLLTIEALKVGDHVRAQTFKIADEAAPRAAILEFMGP